jgi:hypothetical protein
MLECIGEDVRIAETFPKQYASFADPIDMCGGATL